MSQAQDLSNEILSEIELDAVLRFKADPLTFSAVKKCLLAILYRQGVIKAGAEHDATQNFALNLSRSATSPKGTPLTDEELGQNLRAMTYGVQLIEGSFTEISEMEKPVVEKELEENPAE